ncbi:hypothetical protein Glove_632g23 [Diversispora epigaea]|uniref:Uncharacterized protein n=1 Tax=Diversispora epigaea TaxID=1348612 RepID=A0A397GDI7_9GLOM|nr:hypothetical protein Glove_632g23 [Diversispora epigaea]
MSSELELLKQRVINLETENAKLKQIIEEIANLRIENTKLKQIIKQNRTTNNVSQSSVSPSLSVTLQTPIPSSIIAHSGTDNNTNSVNLEQTQSAISPEINSNNNLDHPSSAEKVENILDNTSNHSTTASNNSDIHQESIISSHEVPASNNFDTQQELETPTSPIPAETISLEEKEENEFLNLRYKEQVSKEIMERIREKKLRDQEALSTPQDTRSIIISEQMNDQSKSQNSSSGSQSNQSNISEIKLKIPYNQKVERGLRREISVYDQDNSNEINTPCTQIGQSLCIPNIVSDSGARLKESLQGNSALAHNTFDVQIPDFSLETILTGSNSGASAEAHKVTAQNIVDLFNIAMKIRRKEILYWYCYYKAHENRIRNIRSINKINDKSARMLVYNEIKSLLPNITDVNLRKITSRAKKIYILVEGIGMDRIRQVTYSASAISSLKDIQIQNIINDFPKKPTDINMICVTNCHGNVIVPSSDNITNRKDQTNTEVSMPPTSQSEKALLETEASILPENVSPENQVSSLSVPQPQKTLAYTHAYFRNKLLEQYPNLYKEYSDGNDDYYGINAESLCPLCKLEHENEEGIEGEYKDGSYYIKCEVSEISIVMPK